MWNFLQSIINTSNFIKHIQTSYDPNADLFTDPNVYSTEVVGWGNTSGMDHLDDNMVSSTYYFHQIITALKTAGYSEGHDLFGAPYDFRLENFKSVAADGGLFSKLKTLVEGIVSTTGKPVFFVSDGVAASILRHFLAHYVDADWKAANVAGWVSAGGGFGGSPLVFHYLISYKPGFIPTLSGQQMWESSEYYAGFYWCLPTLAAFPSDYVLAQVTTSSSSFNITIDNITEGFKRSDGDTAAAAAQNTLSVLSADFDPPGVPLYYYYGTGKNTVASEVYSGGSDSNWWQTDGKATYTDGDGLVTVASATAPEQWQSTTTTVIQGTAIPGADMQGIISNDVFLKAMVSIVTAGGWEVNHARPLFEVSQKKTRIFLDHARTLENQVQALIVAAKEKLLNKKAGGVSNRRGRGDAEKIRADVLKAITATRAFVEIYTSAEASFDAAARAALAPTLEAASTAPVPQSVVDKLEAVLGARAAEVVAQLDAQHAVVVQLIGRVVEEAEARLM